MVVESSTREINDKNNSQAVTQNESMYLEPEGNDTTVLCFYGVFPRYHN